MYSNIKSTYKTKLKALQKGFQQAVIESIRLCDGSKSPNYALSSVLILISLIQILTTSFHIISNIQGNDSYIANIIIKLIGIARTTFDIQGNIIPFVFQIIFGSTYIIFLYALWIMQFFRNNNYIIIKIFSEISYSHQHFLYYIIHIIFIKIIHFSHNNNNNDIIIVNHYHHSPIILTFGLIIILANFLITIAFELLYHRYLPEDILYRWFSNDQLVLIMIKFALGFLNVFAIDNFTIHITTLFLLIIWLISIYLSVYFNNKVYKIKLSFGLCSIFIILIGFFELSELNNIDFLYFVFACICAYGIKLIFLHIHTRDTLILTTLPEKLKNPSQCMRQYCLLQNYIQMSIGTIHNESNRQYEELIIKGLAYSLRGSSNCMENCPDSKIRSYIKYVLDEYLLTFSHSIEIKFIVLNHYAKQESYQKKAHIVLDSLEDELGLCNLGFKATLHTLKNSLFRKIIENDKSCLILDIRHYVDYKQYLEQFILELLHQIDRYENYWSYFKHNEHTYKIISTLGTQMINKENDITNKWNKLIEQCGRRTYYPYFLYGMYNLIAINCPIKARNLLKSFEQILTNQFFNYSSELYEKYLFRHQNIYFIISGQAKNLGKIIGCSNNIFQILGYNKQELIEKDLDILLPSIYHSYHKSYIRFYFEYGESQMFYKTRRIFILNKNKNLIPCLINIVPDHDNVTNIKFLAVIQPLLDDDYDSLYLLVDDNGYIINTTLDAEKRLLLSNDAIMYNKIDNINQICPDYHQIQDAFNQIASQKLLNYDYGLASYQQRQHEDSVDEDILQIYHKYVNGGVLRFILKDPRKNSNTTAGNVIIDTTTNINCLNIDFTCMITDQIMHLKSLNKDPNTCNNNNPNSDPSTPDQIGKIIRILRLLGPIQDHYEYNLSKNKSEDITLHKGDEHSTYHPIEAKYLKLVEQTLSSQFLTSFKEQSNNINYSSPKTVKSVKIDVVKIEPKTILENEDNCELNFSANLEENKLNIQKYRQISTRFEFDLQREKSSKTIYDNNTKKMMNSLSKNSKIISQLPVENNIIQEGINSRNNKKSFSQDIKLFKKIEIIINKKHLSKMFAITQCLVYLFVLINLLFTFLVVHNTNQALIIIDNDMNAITLNSEIANNFIELNRKCIIINLISQGLLDDNIVNYLGVKNLTRYTLSSINQTALAIKDSTTKFMNFLAVYSPEYYRDQIKKNSINLSSLSNLLFNIGNKYDFYEATNVLVAISLELVQTRNFIGLERADYVKFIINNTLNDYLVNIMQESRSFAIEINTTMNFIYIFGTMIIIIAIAIITLQLSIIIYLIIESAKDKESIFYLFGKIRDFELKIILDRLIFLKKIFKIYNINLESFANLTHSLKEIEAKFGSNQDQKPKRGTKIFKRFHLHRDSFIRCFKILLISIITPAFYLLHIISLIILIKSCTNTTQQINNSYTYLSQQGLSLSLLLNYLQNNGSGLAENRPLEEVLEQSIQSIQNNLDIIENYQNDGYIEPQIADILNGDLCEKLDVKAQSICYSHAKTIGSNGLIALNSWQYSVILQFYDLFKSSNGSIEVTKQIFQDCDLRDLEIIYLLCIRPGYKMIIDIILYEYQSLANSTNDNLIIEASIYSIIILHLYFFGLMPIIKKIQRENHIMSKLLSFIPCQLFIHNSSIKTYLIKRLRYLLHVKNIQ